MAEVATITPADGMPEVMHCRVPKKLTIHDALVVWMATAPRPARITRHVGAQLVECMGEVAELHVAIMRGHHLLLTFHRGTPRPEHVAARLLGEVIGCETQIERVTHGRGTHTS